MAWTAPATWSVSEVVTASKMNTHVRDNLKYLKGQAGAVAIEDEITIVGSTARVVTFSTSGASVKGYLGANSAGLTVWDVNRDTASGSFGDTAKSHARMAIDGSGSTSLITFNTANAANTAATERMRISGAGLIGINTAAPTGPLEVRASGGTPGGLLSYQASAIGGSTVTLVADGTGDAASGMYAIAHVKRTGSTYQQYGGTFTTTPGGGNTDIAIWTDGGTNALTLRISSAGAVQLVRTTGSSTYDVSMLLLWL